MSGRHKKTPQIQDSFKVHMVQEERIKERKGKLTKFGATPIPKLHRLELMKFILKVAFFQKVRCVFRISKSPKKYIPKNYPELEF